LEDFLAQDLGDATSRTPRPLARAGQRLLIFVLAVVARLKLGAGIFRVICHVIIIPRRRRRATRATTSTTTQLGMETDGERLPIDTQLHCPFDTVRVATLEPDPHRLGLMLADRQLVHLHRATNHAFISCAEPQKVFETLEDPDWVESMHEELNNFKRNKVCSLVEKPKDCRNITGTKWVFKNKQDANGMIVRNKARLVAQGYSQVEGMEYGETYAPVAHLKSICILLAYASHHNFKLHQMDVKSAFLNGPLHELVYVTQPRALRTLISQTMSINSIRCSMALNKPHVHCMSILKSC
jgi:hypothetical protein